MAQMMLLRLVAVLMVSSLVAEAAAATFRSKRGDDGGDDGGGLGGALGSMLGGAGGDGDGADDDDDDANMVGGHKKKKAGSGGGIDEGALEKGLQAGGVNQLTMMLKAMKAAQSPSMQHIIKGDNGEEMYDFRDLDENTTTFAPIQMTERPTMPPKSQAFAIPSAPVISMGADGKISGLNTAEAQVTSSQAAKGKLVVGRPQPAAPQPQVQAAQPVSQPMAPLVLPVRYITPSTFPLPETQLAAPGVPLATGLPFLPMAQVSTASSAVASGLYQGLAMLNQNMNVLMSEAAALTAKQASTEILTTKIDQTSQNFLSYENKMEKRVKALEDENTELHKEMHMPAHEVQAVEQKVPKKQALRGQVPKVMSSAAQKAKNIKSRDHKLASILAASMPKANQHNVMNKQGVTSPIAKVVSSEVQKATSLKNISSPIIAIKAASTPKAVAYATKPWKATFSVNVDGKAGGKMESFTIMVHPEWAPEGAKRFQDMLQAGILNDARFFRVVPGFMVQFGLPGSPKVAKEWVHKPIPDDKVIRSNARGMLSFAAAGPNSRTIQMFVNYANNEFLDKQGFAPFAHVVGDGMKVVDSLQAKYKESPNQGKIQHHGNKYLMKYFPQLSFVDHIETTLTKVQGHVTLNAEQQKTMHSGCVSACRPSPVESKCVTACEAAMYKCIDETGPNETPADTKKCQDAILEKYEASSELVALPAVTETPTAGQETTQAPDQEEDDEDEASE